MAMPDDNLTQAERDMRRRKRPGMATPGGAGNPSFPTDMGGTPYAGPAKPAAVAGPMTRTLPGGFQDTNQAREQLRVLQRQRMRDINTALTTNDPGVRAAAIGSRDSLEGDIRSIGAAMPRQYLTPEGMQASRERMRVQLEQARKQMPAFRSEYKTDALYAAGAEGAPQSVLTPMQNPADEARRQQMIRLKGMDPKLEGPIGEQYVTSGAEQEMRRREAERLKASTAYAKPASEVFPDVSPEERAANDARYQDQANRMEYYGPKGAEAVKDNVAQTARVKELQRGQLSLAEATQKADIAEQGRRSEGNDTTSVENKIRLADAQRRLKIAEMQGAGALEEADRTAPTATNTLVKDHVQRLEALMPEIVNPGLSRIGYGGPEERDQTIRDVTEQIYKAIPSLSPAQRQEYASSLQQLMFKLRESTNTFGRGDYRTKYVEQLRQLVAALSGGQ